MNNSRFILLLFSNVNKFSSKGISLIQVMALAAALSTATVITMNQQSSSKKKTFANHLGQELIAFQAQIEGVLANEDDCTSIALQTASFAGLDVSASASPTTLNFGADVPNSISAGNIFLELTSSNSRYYGFSQKLSLDAITLARSSLTAGTLTLSWTYNVDNGEVLGVREFSRVIDLVLTGDATSITGCNASPDGATSSDGVERFCTGPGAILDTTNNRCYVIGLNPLNCPSDYYLQGLTFNASTMMMDPVCETLSLAYDTSGCYGSSNSPYGFLANGNIDCKAIVASDIWDTVDSNQQNLVEEYCPSKMAKLNFVNNKLRVDCDPGNPIYFSSLGQSKSKTICGIMRSEYSFCWGYNGTGQVGDSTTTHRNKPTYFNSSTLNIEVASNSGHSCVIATGSTKMYCVGENTYGQLGDGSTTNSTTPVKVDVSALPIGDQSFAKVSVGNQHTCGISTSGKVYCWGRNHNGQLGDGLSISDHHTPYAIFGTDVYSNIQAGNHFTCGYNSTAGKIKCWGLNSLGQLGNGSSPGATSVPTNIDDSGGTITFAPETLTVNLYHACAITSDYGKIFCWGSNAYGQLGTGDFVDSSSPVGVLSSSIIAPSKISAGGSHTCVVSGVGEIWCWGANSSGEVSSGCSGSVPTYYSSPIVKSGSYNFVNVNAGNANTCGISSTGILYCWGHNDLGQLGNGTNTNSPCPSMVISP